MWFTDLAPDAQPIRISDAAADRAWQVSVTPAGRIAWAQLNGRKSKEQFSDLVVRCAPSPPSRASEGGGRSVVLRDQHISSYAFSPDGRSLAWSGLGSMFIVNLEGSASREIPLHGIHRQLLNHSVYQFAWRPDGKVIAIQCGFLGGISRGPTDPNEPWPRMFAEDKVFFIPVDFTPTAESLAVTNENFPSPMADDPKAEISPPAGDQSKPWWIRELPMRAIDLKWITVDAVQARLNASS